ncbi:MAG: HD domain-containing protein [Clostridia bacterium]|nr:HD domain-containing protein [Clostridia bacterium]MBQ7122685.1 HD domain-containing protein [Clostridia bacterium]
MKDEKLKNQIKFVMVIDEMKNIFRRNLIIDGSRRENDAEHSWHLAMLAMILEEYSAEKIDLERVLKIALVHDLIEVYAGDTFAYDEKGYEDKEEREKQAADKLFGMLDSTQGAEIRALWDEFEAMETAESRYANAIDRIQPLILNYMTNGHTWKLGDVHSTQIYKRMDIIRTATPELWHIVEGIINTSIEIGILKP